MTKKTLYPFYMIIYKSYVKELVIGMLVRLASICNKNIALLLPKKDFWGNHVIFCGEKFAKFPLPFCGSEVRNLLRKFKDY